VVPHREHRFCSEFGFQSFPSRARWSASPSPEDRNITSYVMEHHQRSGIGNTDHHALHARLVPHADGF
jgi:beta-galactosidase/beta-glucuronidase